MSFLLVLLPFSIYFQVMLNSLFLATDYRMWLQMRTEELKAIKPQFSARYVAHYLGIDPAHFHRILKQEKHLSPKHCTTLAKLYALTNQEAHYFETLIHFNTAKSAKDCQKYFLELQNIRGIEHRILEDDRHEYYSHWLHPAMRTLISLIEFRGTSYKRLGELFRIPIPEAQAEQSVQLLLRLQLIAFDENGLLKVCDRVVSSGDSWQSAAILNFQKSTLDLAQQLLDHVPRAERDISTLTIPMSKLHLDDLKNRLREFRHQIIHWAKDLEHEDSVYQLNLQLFPLADSKLSNRKQL